MVRKVLYKCSLFTIFRQRIQLTKLTKGCAVSHRLHLNNSSYITPTATPLTQTGFTELNITFSVLYSTEGKPCLDWCQEGV